MDCGEKVREHTGDKIEYVFDTISTEPSAAVCAEAMSSTGGRYACILAVNFPRRDCETDFVMGYTINAKLTSQSPKPYYSRPRLMIKSLMRCSSA